MALLTDTDLSYVRSEAEKALPDTCEIEARSEDSDGQGGMEAGYRIVYKDVWCRLSERERPGARVIADGIAMDAEWVITVPFDQEMRFGWRIVHQGERYLVRFVNDARSHDTVRRVLCRRIDGQ